MLYLFSLRYSVARLMPSIRPARALSPLTCWKTRWMVARSMSSRSVVDSGARDDSGTAGPTPRSGFGTGAPSTGAAAVPPVPVDLRTPRGGFRGRQDRAHQWLIRLGRQACRDD